MSQGNRTEQHGTQVLHVRGDSDSDLDALFSVIKGKDINQLQVQSSFIGRKLPPSFFQPPDPSRILISHSREGSQDSQDSRKSGGPTFGQGLGPNGLPIVHVRSRSSPAQLPNTLSAAPPLPPPHHMKQISADLLEDGHGAVPQGWDISNSKALNVPGQRYFINDQSTGQWPAGSPAAKSNSTNALNHVGPALSPSQSQHTSPNISLQNLGPLPPGWEQGVTQDGEIYFINHINRTTSWFDPRIPKQLQRPGPIKVNAQPHGPPQLPQLPQLPQQQQPQQLNPQQQQQQPQQPQQPQPQQLPQQQPQQLSPNPQTPVSVAQQQQQQQQQQPVAGPMGRPPLPSTEYIQTELQRLQREKDRLRREQDEIVHKELMLKGLISPPHPSQGAEGVPTSTPQTSAMQPADPFLGQGGNSLESHARQNSADSGLGGMGTNYSLPRTPEDFLTNVDEMDTQDGGHKSAKVQNSDFNMNDLQGNSVSMEMGNLDVNDLPSGMDSDDLVPSLQEDISGLSSELLNDVDVQKMENLLWL